MFNNAEYKLLTKRFNDILDPSLSFTHSKAPFRQLPDKITFDCVRAGETYSNGWLIDLNHAPQQEIPGGPDGSSTATNRGKRSPLCLIYSAEKKVEKESQRHKET